MIYVISETRRVAALGLDELAQGMQTANAVVLGAIIGAMMATNMGSPVNKGGWPPPA